MKSISSRSKRSTAWKSFASPCATHSKFGQGGLEVHMSAAVGRRVLFAFEGLIGAVVCATGRVCTRFCVWYLRRCFRAQRRGSGIAILRRNVGAERSLGGLLSPTCFVSAYERSFVGVSPALVWPSRWSPMVCASTVPRFVLLEGYDLVRTRTGIL